MGEKNTPFGIREKHHTDLTVINKRWLLKYRNFTTIMKINIINNEIIPNSEVMSWLFT